MKLKKIRMKYLANYMLPVSMLLLTSPALALPTFWQTLAPGLSFAALPVYTSFSFGNIYAFRFDLEHYQLALAFAKDQQQNVAQVNQLTTEHKAVIGVNGGFFSTELNPLGLRIHNGTQRIPIRPISWWGVFLIKNNVPQIVEQKSFYFHPDISFAVQSGPRLLVHGEVPRQLKPGFASRTALCITGKSEVIVLATENLWVTTSTLGQIIRKSQRDGGLDCVDALNLDGGRSTQLYAKIGKFELNLPGLDQVTDAVIVVPKS